MEAHAQVDVTLTGGSSSAPLPLGAARVSTRAGSHCRTTGAQRSFGTRENAHQANRSGRYRPSTAGAVVPKYFHGFGSRALARLVSSCTTCWSKTGENPTVSTLTDPEYRDGAQGAAQAAICKACANEVIRLQRHRRTEPARRPGRLDDCTSNARSTMPTADFAGATRRTDDRCARSRAPAATPLKGRRRGRESRREYVQVVGDAAACGEASRCVRCYAQRGTSVATTTTVGEGSGRTAWWRRWPSNVMQFMMSCTDYTPAGIG